VRPVVQLDGQHRLGRIGSANQEINVLGHNLIQPRLPLLDPLLDDHDVGQPNLATDKDRLSVKRLAKHTKKRPLGRS
jgi:hypothetical protein